MNGHIAQEEVLSAFKTWLVDHGGYIHPDVDFKPVLSGYNVVATDEIPRDARVVSCPFPLAITPQASRRAIATVLALEETSSALEQWSERQLICTYVCLHRILDPTKAPALLHRPYVDILPSPDKLRTPLHFTGPELNLFRGTNLYGATLDRQRVWEAEWEDCRDFIKSHNAELAGLFTWNQYLTAATYLSSRAFPSTLLSESPSLISTPTAFPILLPGVDSLNHARAQPVSWVVTHPNSATSFPHVPAPPLEPAISLVLHTPTRCGGELLNNYGPKPNAELILGYGFALPNNPDDTIVLKIGGVESADSKWEVGRRAQGAEPVWEAVKDAVRAQHQYEAGEEEVEDTYSTEDELWATEVLADMAEDLMSRLPSGLPAATSEAPVRPEVVKMFDSYLEGQRDILQSLMDFAKVKEESIIQLARERGIEIVEDSS